MNSRSVEAVLPVFSTELLYVTDRQEVPEINANRRLLVFVRTSDWNEGAQQLVDKMMKACKLEATDYEVISCQSPSVRFRISGDSVVETVISFGVSFDQEFFRLNKKLYSPFRFHQYKWLLADPLSSFFQQEALKAKLWNEGLKPLFGIQ